MMLLKIGFNGGWCLYWYHHLHTDPSVLFFFCVPLLSVSALPFLDHKLPLLCLHLSQWSIATVSKCCCRTCNWEERTEVIMLWLYLCKIHRRSFGNIDEAEQISLEDALRSKEIHAAFISTENRSHEETIRYFVLLFLLFSLASTFRVNLGT